eukprot:4184532-Pleurochrysis_carterae.AAC.1
MGHRDLHVHVLGRTLLLRMRLPRHGTSLPSQLLELCAHATNLDELRRAERACDGRGTSHRCPVCPGQPYLSCHA